MLTSLALVFLVGLALAALCQKLKLPRIIGMLATGILLGPCVLNVLDGSILSISADLRKLALVIILLKAKCYFDCIRCFCCIAMKDAYRHNKD
jgi:NhaP-type Na+/H+ or K+/H+ antiporter